MASSNTQFIISKQFQSYERQTPDFCFLAQLAFVEKTGNWVLSFNSGDREEVMNEFRDYELSDRKGINCLYIKTPGNERPVPKTKSLIVKSIEPSK